MRIKYSILNYRWTILQWVGSIDLANSEEADANVVVAPDVSWCDQVTSVK